MTQTDTGTDGMVTGPTVDDTGAAAKAVPESATQQPIAAATTETERVIRMSVASWKGVSTCGARR